MNWMQRAGAVAREKAEKTNDYSRGDYTARCFSCNRTGSELRAAGVAWDETGYSMHACVECVQRETAASAAREALPCSVCGKVGHDSRVEYALGVTVCSTAEVKAVMQEFERRKYRGSAQEKAGAKEWALAKIAEGLL